MDYVVLTIAAVAGVALGVYFSSRFRVGRVEEEQDVVERKRDLVAEQAKQKEENKEKILEYLRENERVANDDVEKLLDVSDATATRYLSELEEEGMARQVGTTGHAVYYVLK